MPARKVGIEKSAVKGKENLERVDVITLRDDLPAFEWDEISDDEAVLRDSKRSKITALLCFIKRTEDTKSTLKISKVTRSGNIETTTDITINDHEINQLATYIQKATSLKDLPKGKYLTVPIDGTGISLAGNDPAAAAKALMTVIAQPELMKHVHEAEIPTKLVDAIRLGYRLQVMQAGIAKLKTLLEADKHDEQDYQKWIQEYSWGLGSHYITLEKIHQFDRTHKLDALVRNYTGYCDAIELKRPDMNVLGFDKSHNSYFFTRESSMAIGQTAAYVEKLHHEARRGLEGEDHIKAFYPHGTVVIGRSHDWSEAQHQGLQLLNGHQHRIRVITYDHLLKIAENLIAQLSPETTELPNPAT